MASGDQDTAVGTPRPVRFQRPAQVKRVGLHGGCPPRGWVPPGMSSASRSIDTTWFASRSSSASTARCRGPPSGTIRPDLETSSGPRMPNVADPVSPANASAIPPTRPVPSGRRGQRFQTIPPPARCRRHRCSQPPSKRNPRQFHSLSAVLLVSARTGPTASCASSSPDPPRPQGSRMEPRSSYLLCRCGHAGHCCAGLDGQPRRFCHAGATGR